MLKEDVLKIIREAGTKPLILLYGNDTLHVNARDIRTHTNHISYDWISIDYSSIKYLDTYKKIDKTWPNWGSDPEFFFTKGGKVIPSTKVLPPGTGKVVRDGFQGELNPDTNTCRQVSGGHIYTALKEAHEYAHNIGAQVSLSVGVEVDKDTFYSVPKEERRFGCSPTENVHEKMKRVTGTRTRFRSGGGHVHIGADYVNELYDRDAKSLISLMDIICGVGCVLIDRDPANVERRKHYGRAGEHRKKRYGLEYRVPSNFWLRHYTLWSMVTVMLRNALDVALNDELKDKVLSAIDIKDVRDAINNNDKELAMKIYQQYAEIIKADKITFGGGLGAERIDLFLEWAANDDPISMLPGIDTPLETWSLHRYEGEVPGLETFLAQNY